MLHLTFDSALSVKDPYRSKQPQASENGTGTRLLATQIHGPHWRIKRGVISRHLWRDRVHEPGSANGDLVDIIVGYWTSGTTHTVRCFLWPTSAKGKGCGLRTWRSDFSGAVVSLLRGFVSSSRFPARRRHASTSEAGLRPRKVSQQIHIMLLILHLDIGIQRAPLTGPAPPPFHRPKHVVFVGAGAVGCFYASRLHHVRQVQPLIYRKMPN